MSRSVPVMASLLVRAVSAVILALLLSSGVSAQRLESADQIRLVAFEYLATTLFPADTTSSLTYCVGLHDGAAVESPPEGPDRDPEPALLTLMQRVVRGASPISNCELPDEAGIAIGAVSPVMYSVGTPARVGSVMRVSVGYHVSGMHGGGWLCSVRLERRVWRVSDCLPTWIS